MNVCSHAIFSRLPVPVSVLVLLLVSGTSGETQNASTGSAKKSPVMIRAVAEARVMRFGEPLKIEVSFENSTANQLLIPVNKIALEQRGWRAFGRGGTGSGNRLVLTSSADVQTPIVVPPFGNVSFVAEDRSVTVLSLDSIEAEYELVVEDKMLRRSLPASLRFSLRFEVMPSELMEGVWSAKTDAERNRWTPGVRDLLRLRAAKEDRDYVENTFNYLAGYALPYLEILFRDPDPKVRRQVVEQYRYSAWAVGNLNSILNAIGTNRAPIWAQTLTPGDEAAAQKAHIDLAVRALQDLDSGVRTAAVELLTYSKDDGALDHIRQLISDSSESVRAAVQTYLANFPANRDAVNLIVGSLSDNSEAVREKALAALERSPSPPPLEALRKAFRNARGEAAVRLLALIYEQEDLTLPGSLLDGFQKRSDAERIAIVTAIAGHRDHASLELVKLALDDEHPQVQRAGLLRLLAFPESAASPLLDRFAERAPTTLQALIHAVRNEINERTRFRFLAQDTGDFVAGVEIEFPSRHGTVPIVSPDGEWVAYVETGWSRPGGTGGFGRSNLLSLVHVVRSNGEDDRLVSDMFLVGWMGNSKAVGTARDGFAAICDLDGHIIAEFGEPFSGPQTNAGNQIDWRQGNPRIQFGGASMPHRRRLVVEAPFGHPDLGENCAFSPDGRWFGPFDASRTPRFIDHKGETLEIQSIQKTQIRQTISLAHEDEQIYRGGWLGAAEQSSWSPDGRYLLFMSAGLNRALMMNVARRTGVVIEGIDSVPRFEDWDYRRCRWNPWAKDGSMFAFVRDNQIWLATPNGSGARQITFDYSRKAFPTFSPDGKRIAYVTWHHDNRRHHWRLGPTDLWVVEIATTLAARITGPSEGRIYCLDWLDGKTVIFDRVIDYHRGASLRRISL